MLPMLSKQVTIADKTFTVTALPLGILRHEVMPALGSYNVATNSLDPVVMDVMLKAVSMSLSKTEPDLTVEVLENNLLLADLSTLFMEVIAVSGLSRETSTGEALSPSSQTDSGESFTGLS
jgi:hypothetical protein